MGDYADDILDGLVDGVTGEIIDGDAPGYPRSMKDADLNRKAKFERKGRYAPEGTQAPERPFGQSAAGVVLAQIKAAGGSVAMEAIRIPWVHNNQVPAVVLGMARRGRVEIDGSLVREKGGAK